MEVMMQTLANRILMSKNTNSSGGALRERSEIDESFQWNLADVYPDDDAWEADFRAVENALREFAKYKGRLRESANTLFECIGKREAVEQILGKLYLYAGLKNDEDSRIPRYQAFRDRVTGLSARLQQETAYIHPEILEIPKERLWQFLDERPERQIYRHYFEDLLRSREHVLPASEENLLAMSTEIAQGPYHIFSMFNNADLKFPSIKDENGEKVEVTKGRYLRFMESPDRRVREDAFGAMYGAYAGWKNTLAATLSTAVKKNIFYARARRYSSALQAALDGDNIPPAVYQNVVKTIGRHLQPLHRYGALRKQILQLDALQPWDLFVPLVQEDDPDVDFAQARSIVLEALRPLGDTYLQALSAGMDGGWIDVYENQGKRSGAYSWSTYGVHPYVLLNFNNRMNDMFTLAHEMGHALHSYFTHKNQPFVYGDYTIFVAEVASTLNEALLMNHLIKNTREPRKKFYLLNQYADQIRSTVYIQTLFAEFEKAVHEKAEAGTALTAELLSDMTRELYTRYLGPELEMGTLYQINWARIPHFYYNFYVYKYVTGFSAATALAKKIMAGDQAARDAYLTFLGRGSSDYSINLLRAAGVDMTSPEPIKATTAVLNDLVEQMETLKEKI